MRCKGIDIDPEFRENFCGMKRITPTKFPCSDCDLLDKRSHSKEIAKHDNEK